MYDNLIWRWIGTLSHIDKHTYSMLILHYPQTHSLTVDEAPRLWGALL